MINTNECMLWAGYKNTIGYGQLFQRLDGVEYRYYAHRLIYELYKGKIPEGLVIDHLCRVRHCVNPDHLEAVTARVNTLRGEGVTVNTRKSHCPEGHPYTPENTQRFGKSEWRRCRTCNNERHKLYRLARKPD